MKKEREIEERMTWLQGAIDFARQLNTDAEKTKELEFELKILSWVTDNTIEDYDLDELLNKVATAIHKYNMRNSSYIIDINNITGVAELWIKGVTYGAAEIAYNNKDLLVKVYKDKYQNGN